MVMCANDIAHATNVWMVQQSDDGSFPRGTDLLGVVGLFSILLTFMFVGGMSRYNLDRDLDCRISDY